MSFKPSHKLPTLVLAAEVILSKTAPAGCVLTRSVVRRLKEVARDLDFVDSGSFAFRYPVDTNGRDKAGPDVSMSLDNVATTLSGLLEDLDTLDYAIRMEIEMEQEVLTILHDG